MLEVANKVEAVAAVCLSPVHRPTYEVLLCFGQRGVSAGVHVRACVRACVSVYVGACMCAHVRARVWGV